MNKLVAHRGLYNDAIPENSKKAFQNALKYKYDIEIDIRKTKDNVLIVFHDDNLQRLFNQNIRVRDLTYHELQKYHFRDDTSIFSLKDFLQIINGKVGILIEIKDDNCEELLIKELKDYQGYYEIQSFNINHLLNIKRLNKNIHLGLLVKKKLSIYIRIKLLILKPSFISIYYKLIGTMTWKKLKKYPMYLWTVKYKWVDIYKDYEVLIFEDK